MPARKGWTASPLVFAIIVTGLAVSLAVAASIASHADAEMHEWVAERGEVVQAATEETVQTAVDGLNALAAFIENSEVVTEEEFEGFVAALDPTVRLVGVAYLPIVPRADLAAHVAEARETIPGYAVSTLDDAGEVRPVPLDRDVYYPVRLFHSGSFLDEALAEEAESAATLSIGFDAGSEEAWLPGLEFAIAANSPSVSEFVEVGAGETILGKAFIVSVPVHDDAGVVTGLVTAPMIDFLLAAASDLQIVRDVTWTIGSEETLGGDTSWSGMIELPGAVWSIVVEPKQAALDALRGVPFWIVIAAGLLMTALLATSAQLVAQRTRQHRRMVELQRIAEEKDRFLASVSHEIRTPLTVVAGLAHELRERRDGFTAEEADELLAILAEQSDEVAAIVDDLLVAARADMGKVAITLSVVDLKREVRIALDGAEIAARISGNSVHAWADAQRVRQILRNLLSNARRYGGTYREVRLGRDDDLVWVEVADSGPPIPEEDREKMFDAYTGTGEGGSHVGSMGLGLFISRKLARLLGGDLGYTHDGAFGVFRLQLPMAEEPQREPARV